MSENTLSSSSIVQITPDELLIDSDTVLIDLRTDDVFMMGHIDGAINFCLQKTLWVRFLKQRYNYGSLERFLLSPDTYYEKLKNPPENTKFVFYDNDTTSIENIGEEEPLRVLTEYFAQSGLSVSYIKGGFEAAKDKLINMIVTESYSAKYSLIAPKHILNSPIQSPSQKPKTDSSLDFFLDTGFMAIGSEQDAHNIELLNQHNVTHVLNCTPKDFHPEVLATRETMQIPINDNGMQDIISYLKQAFEFIHTARSTPNSKLLVHCYAGISRSVSIAIAYVMWAESMSYEDGLNLIHSHRNIADPNLGFIGQLYVLGRYLPTSSLDEAIKLTKQFMLS
jgi:protein-tyrosine phosphatase/rhodanese-related sulfurtransferase